MYEIKKHYEKAALHDDAVLNGQDLICQLGVMM